VRVGEEQISELDALAWCRQHHARVRFYSDGSVEVYMTVKRRRKTFVDAVLALRTFLAS
jgi:hypothetical protein